MSRYNEKHKKLSKKRRAQLSEFKFKYDLLVNELFHLKEYISLVEFDPSYVNESESFDRFIKDEKLELPAVNIKEEELKQEEILRNKENIPVENAIKVRRRQLRTSASSSSSMNNNNNPSFEISQSWTDDVEELVTAKYNTLRLALGITEELEFHDINVNNEKSSSRASIPIKLVSKKKDIIKEETIISSVIKSKDKSKVKSKPRHSCKIKEPNSELKDDNKVLNLSDNTPLNIEDKESEYYFTSSSEDEYENPLSKRQKLSKDRPQIKLFVNPPKQTITNPGHVVVPEYGSLAEYLDSFRSMDEDITIEEYELHISEQRMVFAQIRKGLESGALKYDPESDSLQPITTKDTRLIQSHRPAPISYLYKEQNLQLYQDHLVNHGVYMSKLFQNNKRARIARARKVSQMIEQHFRHIAGAEERKLKEEERQRKLLARTAIQAVKKRWIMAERAYRVLKRDEEEELKRIKGKEHLSKILEKSSQLLGAQLNKTVTEESDENSDDSGFSNNEDDDILTSSDEELVENMDNVDNSSIVGATTVDGSLSVEELKNKYKLLHEPDNDTKYSNNSDSDQSMLSGEDSSSDEESENEQTEPEKVSLSALYECHSASEDEESGESAVFKSSDTEEEDMNLSESDDEVSKVQESSPKKSEFSPEELDPLSVVDVSVPELLRGTLRIYQKQGLNWLASLYNNDTNGILADEMGLGKTIQTISLLSYLACEKQNWGPHLIIVPTSVLLNWEMEFKKFAPGFKVLTYYGSPQQRKEKRKGWNKPDAFHVCIVSYQLVVQDQHSFKRKKWQYMILDEAHNIKNFRSTRWQALLNFNTRRRLLLTGTPLQNNIAELWSLLYFLMPKTIVNGKGVSGFADLDAFQQWFGKPVDKIIEAGENPEQDLETKETVNKLHKVLRPYLLRRLKADVEKQMPGKYEHIIYCRLSKRQRFLYDDFMSRAQTKATLASGNFMSIVNCLMQLRKVCNHPDLFEVRPVLSSLSMGHSVAFNYSEKNRSVYKLLHENEYGSRVNLDSLNLIFTDNEEALTTFHSKQINNLKCVQEFVQQVELLRAKEDEGQKKEILEDFRLASAFFHNLGVQKMHESIDSVEMNKVINTYRCEKKPVYGKNLIDLLDISKYNENKPDILEQLIVPLQSKILSNKEIIENYAVITPKVVTLDIRTLSLGLDESSMMDESTKNHLVTNFHNMSNPLHHLQTKLTIAFPDKSLLQYDCGKLQKLASLLQGLKDNGHRALIFTQMTKVLDILEQFLNYHGYLYMRLDGATKIEDRQILTERFNSDPRVTVFILSSRSGGLGINLTGADTVIFYDSDWNPAMDKQCQDRCHRIGQTRDVHIYRFVSEHTIESNILKKANQKRELDNLVIQKGDFTTDYFTKLSVRDLLGSEATESTPGDDKPLLLEGSDASKDPRSLEKLLAQAEDEDDVKAANLAMKEVEVDDEDFTEDTTSNTTEAMNVVKEDDYEGTNHVEEYMLRFIANGYYF